MTEKILVTGGAGFIGSHVARALVESGRRVVVLDALIEQVHLAGRGGPRLDRDIELIRGDIRDATAVRRSLRGVDAVVHLAAEVGVGQSMYALERYVGTNDLGTAVLFEELAKINIRRIVVASSMSIYGEGLYRDRNGVVREDIDRTNPGSGNWDPLDETGQPLTPLPTPESKRPALASVYALGKYVQERMTLMLGRAYGTEACALRLFNVFGPGQSLSNPYTGVLAIFASRLLNGKRPLVFEDGLQRRDFVHVSDVAAAFLAGLYEPAATGRVFNIGSGRARTIGEVGSVLGNAMGKPDLTPDLIGKSRMGDIRHCFADISLARKLLRFEPKRHLEDSVQELVAWVNRQPAVDRVGEARAELEARGLVS